MSFSVFVYNFGVTLIILLAALGFGSLIIKKLLIPHQIEGFTLLWMSEVIGLGGLSVISLLFGMMGMFNKAVFYFMTLTLAAFGTYRAYSTVKAAPKPKLTSNKWTSLLIFIIIFIVSSSLVWSLLVHAMMPPHEWDEIAYHLALAKSYVQAGHIHYVPSIVTSNWPLNFTMLYSIALYWGADIAPHLIMLSMTMLIVSGLVFFSIQYADFHIGWIAALLFLTMPLTKRLSGTGLIDVAMGAYGLAALVAFEQWRIKRQRGWLAICGLCCGFIAGSKLTGTVFVPMLGIIILWVHLSTKQINKRELVYDILTFGLVATCVLIPWYARSMHFTGNPIFPFGFNIFGGRNWDALGDEYHTHMQLSGFSPDLSRDLTGLVQTLWLMLKKPDLLGGYQGGLGIIVPLGFICSLIMLRWAPPLVLVNAFVSVFFFFSWFLFASLQLRYLLPVAPLMTWNIAYLTFWFFKQHRLWLGRVILPLIIATFILTGWPWARTDDYQLFTSRVPYLTGKMTRDQWLEANIDVMQVFSYANNYLPEKSKILLLPFENRGYYIDLLYFWGHPMSQRVIKFETFQDPISLAEELNEMGFTHIIDNPNWIYSYLQFWEHDRALMLALEKQCGKEMYGRNNITLYKLGKCSPGANSVK